MTMAQRKKRYRLYAMGRTRKTEEIAYDTRFYRICAGYILLYLTGRKKPEGGDCLRCWAASASGSAELSR